MTPEQIQALLSWTRELYERAIWTRQWARAARLKSRIAHYEAQLMRLQLY